jgi:hypothetical protein
MDKHHRTGTVPVQTAKIVVDGIVVVAVAASVVAAHAVAALAAVVAALRKMRLRNSPCPSCIV